MRLHTHTRSVARPHATPTSQALQYALIPELLALLDWRGAAGGATAAAPAGGGAAPAGGAGGGGENGAGGEAAVLRVLAVDVLRALQLEGLHSALVHRLLEASPVWTAYRHQRHDLFLPSGAGAGGSVVGLLEAPAVARFALPPPEALGQ
ncbi:hypothetical protein GPECTOR_19g390 [Gonium pectorale]|uniref:Uncharacterized protein n=1 Tax=Gonium pectorale TaxID=33097 RepID=A0A150GJF1_GONPE|nr:hypothetical protein GPECTOR_19g390 [Gonium pectorale]|eukprot:KXZ49939.1 hypothetical protein GPECTOR_19g390 [Gonium pectorale]